LKPFKNKNYGCVKKGEKPVEKEIIAMYDNEKFVGIVAPRKGIFVSFRLYDKRIYKVKID
jgi:hypothetical protein